MAKNVFGGLFGLVLLSGLGCGADDASPTDGTNCNGGKCDNADGNDDGVDAPCIALLKDLSGNELAAEDIRGKDDPIAKIIFQSEAEACPLSVADIAEVLTEACGEPRTAFVSERSQRFGTFIDYRAVTSYDCDNQTAVLHYPILAHLLEDGLSQESLEKYLDHEVVPAIMAETEAGIFNYYQSTGFDVRFFGDSVDMLDGTDLAAMAEVVPPNPSEQQIGATFGIDRSCAACHPSGSMIMRELPAPWVHWEDDFDDNPGQRELLDTGLFGDRMGGASMESLTESSFEAVNDARTARYLGEDGATASVRKLLEPLFCTTELNIDTAASFSQGPEDVDFVSLKAMTAHPQLDGFGSLSIDGDVLAEALADRGSAINTLGPDSPEFLETMGGLTFLFPAQVDSQYIRKISGNSFSGARTLISEEFVNDVLAVDASRGAYSTDRCGLLELADEVDADAYLAADEADKPAFMTQAFIDALNARGSLSAAEAELLANLEDSGNGNRMSDLVESFAETCEARGDAFVPDLVAYVAEVRKRASALGRTSDGDIVIDGDTVDEALAADDPAFIMFRFTGTAGWTMPEDKVARRPGLRFDMNTCELTQEFVRYNDGNSSGGGTPAASSCEARGCGDFDPGATCQCNDLCLEVGDCCDDFLPECRPTDSCQARGCGDFEPGASCQCNDACEQFGDCCDDRALACAG